MGPDARLARDPWHASVRRVCERVPDPYDGDAGASMGDTVSTHRTWGGICRNFHESTTDGIWGERRAQIAALSCVGSGICSFGDGLGIGPLYSSRAGRVVPRRCAVDRVMME